MVRVCNLRFSSMLADEYILIAISPTQLQFAMNNIATGEFCPGLTNPALGETELLFLTSTKYIPT